MKKTLALAVVAAAQLMVAGGAFAAEDGAESRVDGVWAHYYGHPPSAVAALEAIHAGLPALATASGESSVALPPDASNLDTMTATVSPNEDDLGFGDIMQQQQELHTKQMEVRAQREHIRVATRQLEEFETKLGSAKSVLKQNEANLHKWIDALGAKLKAYQERLRKTEGGATSESAAAEEGGDDTKASFRAVHQHRLARLKAGADRLKHGSRVSAAHAKAHHRK